MKFKASENDWEKIYNCWLLLPWPVPPSSRLWSIASACSLESLIPCFPLVPLIHSPPRSQRDPIKIQASCGLFLCSEPSNCSHLVSIKVYYQDVHGLTVWPHTLSNTLSIILSCAHSVPTTLTSWGSLNTSSAVAPQDLSHYYSFCLEHISSDSSVTYSPNSAGICTHAPSSERASLPLRLGSHHHSFPTPATLPLALLYFSYNPYHPQTLRCQLTLTMIHRCKYFYYSHLTDEETGSERWLSMCKITELINGSVRVWTLVWLQRCSI